MNTDIRSLTETLIRIPSDTGETKALNEALVLTLRELEGYHIERFEKNGVESALVSNAPTRPDTFHIILNGHLDVVPGKAEQYIPHKEGDRLYGVGAMDMKASVACLIAAFKAVADTVDYPLGLQLVTDEEVGGFNGAKHQVDSGVAADFVISGEATNLDIVSEAKGVVQLKLTTAGTSAHGAYPWQGDNAIEKMQTLLQTLHAIYPTPDTDQWVTTMNIAHISTPNTHFNKVPDHCEAWLDIRYIPCDTGSVIDTIKEHLPEGGNIDVIAEEPPLYTNPEDPFLAELNTAMHSVTKTEGIFRGAHGTSDARHFARVGGAGVEFGPKGGGIGSDAEWVDLPSLETYFEVVKTFLLQRSGTPHQ